MLKFSTSLGKINLKFDTLRKNRLVNFTLLDGM